MPSVERVLALFRTARSMPGMRKGRLLAEWRKRAGKPVFYRFNSQNVDRRRWRQSRAAVKRSGTVGRRESPSDLRRLA